MTLPNQAITSSYNPLPARLWGDGENPQNCCGNSHNSQRSMPAYGVVPPGEGFRTRPTIHPVPAQAAQVACSQAPTIYSVVTPGAGWRGW